MCLSDLSGCELVSIANAMAVFFSKELDSEELAVLAAFFTSFADNLVLLSFKKV